MKQNHTTLRIILGDQLNARHSWFKTKNNDTLYVIAEMHQEANYVKHHGQKICAFFKAMEKFAHALNGAGHSALHLTLDDTKPYGDFIELATHLCQKYSITELQYQQPDEYRLSQQLTKLHNIKNVTTTIADTEHFLLNQTDADKWIKKDKHNTMEAFYRKMRKRYNLLMDGDKPLGGKWNYDQNNRQKLKPDDLKDIPKPLTFAEDVSDIIIRLNKHNIAYIGNVTEHLIWPTSRKESLTLLAHFCEVCFPLFGTFQDAMTENHKHQWSLYHSRISFSLNSKMLHPKEVINTAIDAFNQNKNIDIAQVEGFVRQILGWREYIRAVYWVNMPSYAQKNALEANNPLPEYFWDGKTKMNCMKHAIDQSLDTAYAHHIQRLMVTGNFSLIAGINPDEVDAWYLGIYIDAIEWVEMPNTRGMSLYADGGLVATKPYASSGNYINKMSDYCKSCHYKVQKKETDDACPFNSLYWGFLHKNRTKLVSNPRISMMLANFEKQDKAKQDATLKRSQWCIDNLHAL